MKKQLKENFDYHDLVDQITPKLSIDEYSAKVGTDDEIITLAFIVKGEQASQDLADWFERGYEWIMDAQISDGEISMGKHLLFVEMPRRTSAPERIIKILTDLETLTNFRCDEWIIEIDDQEIKPDVERLKELMTLSPHQYRLENPSEEDDKATENELNEFRNMAGIAHKAIFEKKDSLLKEYLAKAGL